MSREDDDEPLTFTASYVMQDRRRERLKALREAKDCIVPDGNPLVAAARIQKLIDEVNK